MLQKLMPCSKMATSLKKSLLVLCLCLYPLNNSPLDHNVQWLYFYSQNGLVGGLQAFSGPNFVDDYFMHALKLTEYREGTWMLQ